MSNGRPLVEAREVIRLLKSGGVGRASIFVVLLNVFQIGAAFGVSVILARAMSLEAYGIYSLAISAAVMLAIPAQLGLPNLVARLMPGYVHDARWGEARGLLVSGTLLALLVPALAWIMVSALVAIMVTGLELRAQLTCVLAALPLIAASSVRSSAFRAMGRPVLGQIPEQFVRPVTVLILVVLLRDEIAHVSLTAGWIYVGGSVVAFLLGALLWTWSVPWPRNDRPIYGPWHKWLQQASPFLAYATAQAVLQQNHFLLAGIVLMADEIALLRVAFQSAGLGLAVLTAVNMMLMPEFARRHHIGDFAGLERLARRAALWTSFSCLAALVGGAVIGRYVLGLAFGEPYERAYLPFLIALGGQAAAAIFGFAPVLLTMTGHARAALVCVVVAISVSAVLTLVLAPSLRGDGVAIAYAAGLVVLAVSSAWVAKRSVGVRSWFG